MLLFLQAFFQVFFVALNTYLIAAKKPEYVFIVSFLISYIWSHNVKKLAFGSEFDRILYSTGAACGGISGYFFGKFIS